MITEPTTMLTDYALAGVTAWLGWRLFEERERETSRRHWVLAFAMLAVAALLGGTYHGFTKMLDDTARHLLWKATVFTVGIASFGMLAAVAFGAATGIARKLLLAFAAAKLAVYSAWMLAHDAFIYVIVDTAISFVLLAALHARSALRNRDRASLWILGGVAISVLAASVQASKFALHQQFNHNDLYHVIQIGAMVLFWAGARQLRDQPADAPGYALPTAATSRD